MLRQFAVEAEIRDYVETIAPGAFRHSLATGNDILALIDHDAGRVLRAPEARRCALPRTAEASPSISTCHRPRYANDVLALAERGDLGGMSFAFIPIEEQWDGDRRELRSVDLKEVSRRIRLAGL